MKVREHTKVCDRALIPQATKQFARYDTPPLYIKHTSHLSALYDMTTSPNHLPYK